MVTSSTTTSRPIGQSRLRAGSPPSAGEHGEALQRQRAPKGLEDARVVVDDHDARLSGVRAHPDRRVGGRPAAGRATSAASSDAAQTRRGVLRRTASGRWPSLSTVTGRAYRLGRRSDARRGSRPSSPRGAVTRAPSAPALLRRSPWRPVGRRPPCRRPAVIDVAARQPGRRRPGRPAARPFTSRASVATRRPGSRRRARRARPRPPVGQGRDDLLGRVDRDREGHAHVAVDAGVGDLGRDPDELAGGVQQRRRPSCRG